MKEYDPRIYRCFALQKAKLEKLEELDVLEELSDIDYLSNLKNRISRLASNLTNQDLLPSNFEDLIKADIERVSLIRDTFKKEASNLGSILEETKSLYLKFSEPIHSYDRAEISAAQDKLNYLEKQFKELYFEIRKLHYISDWSPEGDLESNLNEFYHLYENENFLKNVSPAIVLFIQAPDEFEAEIKNFILGFQQLINKCDEEYKQAKLLEPEIIELCENGSIESLLENLSKINRFKDIASVEKNQLLIFDRLCEEKTSLQKMISSLIEESSRGFLLNEELIKNLSKDAALNLCSLRSINKNFAILENDYQKFLQEVQSLKQVFKDHLEISEINDQYNQLQSSVWQIIDTKRSKIRKVFYVKITLLIIAISVILIWILNNQGFSNFRERPIIENPLDVQESQSHVQSGVAASTQASVKQDDAIDVESILKLAAHGPIERLIISDEGQSPKIFHEFKNIESGWEKSIRFRKGFRCYSSSLENIRFAVDGGLEQQVNGSGSGNFGWVIDKP